MIILLGKTATGKTSVAKILEEKYGIKKIVSWTTRPRRKNEKGGVDYNFCDVDDFKRLEKIGFFVETTSFTMADGLKVYYGTPIEELHGDKIMILNPEGFKKMYKLKCLDVESFLIDSPIEILKSRLSQRGDCKAEVLRRLDADENDFYGIEELVNHVIINDDSNTIEDIADEIYKIYTEK